MHAEGERYLKALVGLKGRLTAKLLQVNWGNFIMISRNRQLTAIYQFARAMPILGVPASTNDKGHSKKRKGK